MNMEDSAALESIESVYEQLRTITKKDNIIEDLRSCLSSWDYKSTKSLQSFKEDIQQVIEEFGDIFFPNDGRNTNIRNLIREFVHFEIYDTLFFRIKGRFTKEDLAVYRTCKEFCTNNGTPKQLGSTFYNFTPNAAVVELSMLTNKRTPLQKLKSLQLAYDYIFAEVKGALISVISKYSEKEIDIPSINNREVIPIVMAVILKSKLFYFISDMTYINEFGNDILNSNEHLREIYDVFEESLNKILNLNSRSEDLPSETLGDKLSVCDAINFIETLNKESLTSQSVFNEERKRVARLITRATTEDLDYYT